MGTRGIKGEHERGARNHRGATSVAASVAASVEASVDEKRQRGDAGVPRSDFSVPSSSFLS